MHTSFVSPYFHDGERRSAWEYKKWWPFFVFDGHVSHSYEHEFSLPVGG
jgi:hypothetical protein